MKEVSAKEVMIPISNYVAVRKEHNLVEVLQALEESRQSKTGHAHRDAVVIDETGAFIGKVTMIDIFRALEPNYRKVTERTSKFALTEDYLNKAIRDLNLWMEPTQSICERGASKRVSEVMHVPEDVEYIQESASLELALHKYVLEVHQPLIVKSGDTVTGVLRFGDLFEVVRKDLLSCRVPG